MVLETQSGCMVCGVRREIGVRILGLFLCAGCESEIVHTPPDHPRYDFYVSKVRRLWQQWAQAAAATDN